MRYFFFFSHNAAALIQQIQGRRGNFLFYFILFFSLHYRSIFGDCHSGSLVHRAVSQHASELTDTRRRYKQTSVTRLECKESAGLHVRKKKKKKKTKKEEENLGRNLRLFTSKLNE